MAKTRQVAFIRNIMVGREGLTRAVLLEFFEKHGARDCVSYITTGNIAFDMPSSEVQRFRRRVEDDIEAIPGRHEEIFVRSLRQLNKLFASKPFAAQPFRNPQDRCVSFASKNFPTALQLPLLSKRRDYAIFRIEGKHAFSVTRLVDGKTSGPGKGVEMLLDGKGRITTRSWNTIERILRKEVD